MEKTKIIFFTEPTYHMLCKAAVAEPALSVRRGKVKELSRFLPFLSNFSSFPPLFPDFPLFFLIFGKFFTVRGHSAPLTPQWLYVTAKQPTYLLLYTDRSIVYKYYTLQ